MQKIRLQGLDLFAGNDQSRNDLWLGCRHWTRKARSFLWTKRKPSRVPTSPFWPFRSSCASCKMMLPHSCSLTALHGYNFGHVYNKDFMDLHLIFSVVSLSKSANKQPLEAPAILVLRTAVKQTFQKNQQSECSGAPIGVSLITLPLTLRNRLRQQFGTVDIVQQEYANGDHFIISPNENFWIEVPARGPSGGLHKWLNQPSGPERSCTHGAGAKSWSESHAVSALWLNIFHPFWLFWQ